MHPFLKESGKGVRFPSGLLRKDIALRYRLFLCSRAFSLSRWTLLFGSAELSSLREVAIVLVVRDCSRHIPSRGTAGGCRQQLCRGAADAYLSGANSSPKGPLHPTSTCGWLELRSSHHIYGCIRVGPNGRDLDPP